MTRDVARKFVGMNHRHNLPPKIVLFAVGIADTELRGVAIAGRPVARMLDDGHTIEVIRTCTDGAENGNSMLYGAIWRAARALGYRKAITYTLETESGVSLRASGWTPEAYLAARSGWDCPSRPRVETDLFGNERTPQNVGKIRWSRELGSPPSKELGDD